MTKDETSDFKLSFMTLLEDVEPLLLFELRDGPSFVLVLELNFEAEDSWKEKLAETEKAKTKLLEGGGPIPEKSQEDPKVEDTPVEEATA